MRNLLFIIAAISLVSCNNNIQKADAFGNFEADETLVSSEMSGRILWFNLEEGSQIEQGQLIGLVDTIIPAIQLEEISAQIAKVEANMKSIDAQLDILNQQKENLLIDKSRMDNLLGTGAATQKQIDDINGALKLIEKQVEANLTQRIAASKELPVIASKKMLLDEQLKKCRIENPTKGTVLEKFAEPGEMTATGKPLYKIANLDKITLRAYVSGGQLHQVIKGKTCKVRIDKGKKEFIDFEGTVTWISSQAEFTPKIIQTKEERVNMVYAVKIEVPNNGTIKIGMPGEVEF
ncbi:MAG: HlyD family efflux transporter periplasmic adaptor subunit [Salinivirgaceae bacterium]